MKIFQLTFLLFCIFAVIITAMVNGDDTNEDYSEDYDSKVTVSFQNISRYISNYYEFQFDYF